MPNAALSSAGQVTLIGEATGKHLVHPRITVVTVGTSTYAGGDTSGVTTLLGRLTSTRAGNLDNPDAAISTRSTLTAAGECGFSGRTVDSVDAIDNQEFADYLMSWANSYGVVTNATLTTDFTNLIAAVGNVPGLTYGYVSGANRLLRMGDYTAPDNAGITAAKRAAEAVNARLPAEPAAKSDVQMPVDPEGLVQTITLTNADNDLPIQGAIIRYSQAGVTKDPATTDADGVAEIAVLAGTYTRSVIAGGFDAVADKVIVSDDAEVELELVVTTTGASTNIGPGLAN